MNEEDKWSVSNVKIVMLEQIKQLVQYCVENDQTENYFSKSKLSIFSKSQISPKQKILNKIDKCIYEFQQQQNQNYTLESLKNIVKFILYAIIYEDTDYNKDEIKNKLISKMSQIGKLLVQKNRKYGNSALNPCRIFSKGSKLAQLYVRIDDKLNRIMNRQNDDDEDVLNDLLGYLILTITCISLSE